MLIVISGMCEYYSLWTRENKTFAVNKWGEVLTDPNKNIIIDKAQKKKKNLFGEVD